MTVGQGLRTAGAVLGAVCLLWGALPLTASRIHVGCVAMMGVGVMLVAVCVWWNQAVALWCALWGTPVGKAALLVLLSLVSAVLLLFIGVSGVMVAAAARPAPEKATLIVLGAGLRGERPSRTLRERLDAAADYLNKNPEAVCILTGGQGPDEDCTEAAAMKKYLLDKGVVEERLYLEENATNTDENFEFSRRVAEENGLSLSVAVVTQEFHQCRAQLLAKKHGFEQIGAVTAHTKWDLLPSYWIRDFAGMCRFLLLGY